MLRPATHSAKVRLQCRLNELDRSSHFDFSRDARGLFDFQSAGASWLSERLTTGGYSMLEMATGCGKTRTVAAALASTMGDCHTVLYITQGGLVRQTQQELELFVPCHRAETTRQFEAALQSRARVIVVNVAIPQAYYRELSSFWAVVVDEAHRISCSVLARMRLLRRVVFLTATPTGGAGIAQLAIQAADHQHFVLLKKGSTAEALNMPRVTLCGEFDEAPRDAQESSDHLLQTLTYASPTFATPLLLLLAASQHAPQLRRQAQAAWQLYRLHETEPLRRSLLQRLQHPELRKALQALTALEELPELVELRDALPPPTRKRARELCPCCGLQGEEVNLLRACHDRSVPPARCAPPQDWKLPVFARVVLRLRSAEDVMLYRASCSGSVLCHFISSDLCAAQRANRIRAFSSAHEHPAALQLLLRSGFGSIVGRRVSMIGGGVLLRGIVDFLTDVSFLVSDARCGDVGYNLQFATHILAPCLPRSKDDVHQLTGRAERISTRRGPGVQLLCRARRETAEPYLLHHLQHCLM